MLREDDYRDKILKSAPQELAVEKRWVLHAQKVAAFPIGETRTKSTGWNEPDKWMTLDAALDSLETRPEIDGVSFVLGGGFCGIDLDNAIDADGKPREWAQQILDFCQSYSEVSPSGTGYKIICRGELPENLLQSIPILGGEKREQIEHWNSGRHFCFTGERLEEYPAAIVDIDAEGFAEEVAKINPECCKPTKSQNQTALLNLASPGSYASNHCEIKFIENRIQNYLNTVEFSEGNRNNQLNKKTWTVRGFCNSKREVLPPHDIARIMRNWNESQAEPLPHLEAEKTIESALKGPMPDLNPPESRNPITSPPGVSKSTVNESADDFDKRVAELIDADLGGFPDVKVGGMIEQIQRDILAVSFYPQPAAALAAAFQTVALACGGKVWGRDLNNEFNVTSNLYFLLVMPSGSGKDTPLKYPGKIFSHPDIATTEIAGGGTKRVRVPLSLPPKWEDKPVVAADLVGPEEFASKQGIYSRLADVSAVQLFVQDEIGHMLETTHDARQGHLQGIPQALTRLYTQARQPNVQTAAKADSAATKTIDFPHVSIFGATTPTRFARGINATLAQDGFLARFIVFTGDYVEARNNHLSADELWNGFQRGEAEAQAEVSEVVLKWVLKWLTTAPGIDGPFGFEKTPQAFAPQWTKAGFDIMHDYFRQVQNEREHADEVEQSILARKVENALKLLLVIAIGYQDRPGVGGEMTAQMAENAIAIVEYTAAASYSEYRLQSRDKETTVLEKVIRKIRTESGITKRDLCRCFSSQEDKAAAKGIVDRLIESGKVKRTRRTPDKGGRPSVVYQWVE